MDSATAFDKVVGIIKPFVKNHDGVQRSDRRHADHRGSRRQLGPPRGHHPGVRGRVRHRGGRRVGRQGPDAGRRGPDDPAQDGAGPLTATCCRRDARLGLRVQEARVADLRPRSPTTASRGGCGSGGYRIPERCGACAPSSRRSAGARAAARLREPPHAGRLAGHPVGARAGVAAVRPAGLVLLEPAGQAQHVGEPVRCGSWATSASACWSGRKGPPEEVRRSLDKVTFLLARGQSVLVFPEGGRSRVGRVDTENFMYGVGRMLQESPAARVLCVFARGVGQRALHQLPAARASPSSSGMKTIAPTTTFQGLRADRDLATQIIRQLSEMEQRVLC